MKNQVGKRIEWKLGSWVSLWACRLEGLAFRAQDLGCLVKGCSSTDLRFKLWGLGCRADGQNSWSLHVAVLDKWQTLKNSPKE